MNKNNSWVSRSGLLILLVLGTCAPIVAQHTSDGLGGSFNTPSGGKIAKTITDRIVQRNRERRLAGRRSAGNSPARISSSGTAQPIAKLNESTVLFRPTGTQLKTSEIANLIDAGNPQVLKLLTVLLDEFDKGARAAGH